MGTIESPEGDRIQSTVHSIKGTLPKLLDQELTYQTDIFINVFINLQLFSSKGLSSRGIVKGSVCSVNSEVSTCRYFIL